MTVKGNDIIIDRYNFNTDEIKNLVAGTDTEQDFDKCTTSAGDAWKFTIGSEKSYTYEKRKANSKTPEFAEGAKAEVKAENTTATITFPKASLKDGSGKECLFESYTVEARDSRNGLVKATGYLNTEYHIDADASLRYSDEYSITVSGLKEDTEYEFYVYATNFFGKNSEKPLKTVGRTTGERTESEPGDVNNDMYADTKDLVSLKKSSGSALNRDVDENGVYDDETDLKALYRILLGYPTAVVDSKDDLTGKSTYQKAETDTSCQGYAVQTKTVNDKNEKFTDSKSALEVWATAKSTSKPYPRISLMFDEAQDWSSFNALNFDTEFVDKANKKWYEIRIISGEHNRLSNDVNINADSMDWSTKTIPLKTFTNVDWSNVKGIRFLLNFDYYDGRFDGTTKSQFFVDNMYASYEMIPDNDLLSHYQYGITSEGGTVTKVSGEDADTASMGSCEAYKLVSDGKTASMDVPLEGNPSKLEKISVATKISAGTLTVQAYDKSGNLVGESIKLKDNDHKWTDNVIQASEMGYANVVAGYRFTLSEVTEGAVLLLDNCSVTYKDLGEDTDLIGRGAVTGTGFTANMTDWDVQPYTTNDSETAIHVWSDSYDATDYGHIMVTLPEAIDMTDLQYVCYDIRYGQKTKAWSSVKFYDADGRVSDEIGMDPASNMNITEWNTMTLSAEKLNSKWGKADKTRIQKVDICVNLNQYVENQGYLKDIWIDNLRVVLNDFTEEDTDMLSQVTSVTLPGEANDVFEVTEVGALYANHSAKAYCIGIKEGATNYPSVQLVGPEGCWDMKAYDKLQLDVKLGDSVCQVADIGIRLQYIDEEGEWRVTRWEQSLTLGENIDGWNTGTVDLNKFKNYLDKGELSSAELSKIRAVQVMVRFGDNKLSTEDTIYLDNMKLISE